MKKINICQECKDLIRTGKALLADSEIGLIVLVPKCHFALNPSTYHGGK